MIAVDETQTSGSWANQHRSQDFPTLWTNGGEFFLPYGAFHKGEGVFASDVPRVSEKKKMSTFSSVNARFFNPENRKGASLL
jgi:hypothetical protein